MNFGIRMSWEQRENWGPPGKALYFQLLSQQVRGINEPESRFLELEVQLQKPPPQQSALSTSCAHSHRRSERIGILHFTINFFFPLCGGMVGQ